ncbi:Proline dehydrogenase 1-like 2 [Homarus americanus]|uniref:Proline dehydrogenase 1-like 2 n=1 Tax=Homarus americanus TaxID=6706 RepID=A0A8J5N8C6_HOMAM|nr:Proline dehydrogenase 1-like 2 [Homarus americanus]
MALVLVTSLPRTLAVRVRYGVKYPKICWNLNNRPVIGVSVRHKSTPAAASLVGENNGVDTASHDNEKKDPLDLTFCDHESAFKSKTTWEVLRALLVFQMCGIQPLVKNNEKVRGQPTSGRHGRRQLCHVTLLTW